MKIRFFIGPAILLIVWGLASGLKWSNPFLLPGPISTLQALGRLLIHGAILPDLWATLWRVFLSFIISIVIGLPLGILLGKSENVYRSVEFIVDFFRSTPASALFPLFLLIFGISDKSKIAVAAFASCIIIIFNTAYGVIHAKKSRILAAQIMGASKMQIFRSILVWESLPQIAVGLRSAVSLSLIIIVLTEMFVGSASGLGRRLIDFQITYDIKAMYATILLTGMVGYFSNLIFLLFEKKFLFWTGR